ncbi:hypothetical protein OSI28_08865, partial [Mycobacterium ulcerans]
MGAGPGLGSGVAVWDPRELPGANSISEVRWDSCQPPWIGVNSIGTVNSRFSGWAVVTTTVAT